MTPYFSFLEYKDSDYQQDNGFIHNIQVSGDNPPFTIMVSGPNGYTAGPFTAPTIPDLDNLEPGNYTLTITDNISVSETLDIILVEKPQVILTVSLTNNNCQTSGNCDCELTISSFIHNSNCFKYEVFDNTNNLLDTYTGCTGNEIHVFTGLCLSSYVVIATELDNIINTYSNPYNCSEGVTTVTAADITDNWGRFCVYTPHVIGSQYIEFDNNGNIITTPTVYGGLTNFFAVGSPNEIIVPLVNQATEEGGVTTFGGSANKWYYNSNLNKYFVFKVDAVGNRWITFNPTADQTNSLTAEGNPTSFADFSSSVQWDLKPLTTSQYTIDPNTTQVIQALTLDPSGEMIEGLKNTDLFNGFYSNCGYYDYTHEVTIGSTDGDDDDVGLILAAFKDTEGIYGPVDFTYTISLSFQLFGTPTARLYYNVGNSALAFTDGAGVVTNVIADAISPYTIATGWSSAGNLRIKVIKTGSILEIYTTAPMGSNGTFGKLAPGTPNPYNSTPLFSIDLNDKSSWNIASGLAYVDADVLKKFVINPVKIGYITASQKNAQFFDFAIEGNQSNITPDINASNGAEDQIFIEGITCYTITDCSNPNNTKIIRPTNLLVGEILYPGKVYRFNLSEQEFICWTVEPAPGCPPESIPSTVLEEFNNCEECILEIKQCFDLVACPNTCDDILNFNSFDFDPYIGQQVILNGDSSCIYTPIAIREAFFFNINTSTLSPSGAPLQNGTNLILNVQSLIFNTVQQITGPQPQYILTSSNYNPVYCLGYNCTSVLPNTNENGFSNIPDFLNNLFSSLGIRLEAYNTAPQFCQIGQNQQFFKIQYRDGDTFFISLQLVYGSYTGYITISNTGNISTQTITNEKETTTYELCNTNLYCTAEDSEDVTVDIWNDGCPQTPVETGIACKITPRLGEPGFSTKNCDPDKVISVKCKYADSVYALFKQMRYGIETCCEFDLDKIDIKNQLIDLGSIYDPDLCISGQPVPFGCCLQPCSAVTTIFVPQTIACAAPTNVNAILTI